MTVSRCVIACHAFPWLLLNGYVIAFSALFTKTHRINFIFHQPSFKRIIVTPLDVMLEPTLRQNMHITWSSNDENIEATGSSAQFESKVDRRGGITESRTSLQLGSKVMETCQAQAEMKAENDSLRDGQIMLEERGAKLQNRRDVAAPTKDSSERNLPRVACLKSEPNTDSSVSEDDSDIGLKAIDRRQIREETKTEIESLRQSNKKLKESVVVLKSQRDLVASNEVPYEKKERVRLSFESEPLADAEALVSEAGSPNSHSQQPSTEVSRYPVQNRADHPADVKLRSSDRALESLLCDV
jgi:cell division protein FtsB